MVLDWSGTILPRYYLVRKVPNQANLPAVAGRFPKAQDKTELSQLFPTEKMRSDDDEDADEVDGFDVVAGADEVDVVAGVDEVDGFDVVAGADEVDGFDVF